jgi:hypothetical protein
MMVIFKIICANISARAGMKHGIVQNIHRGGGFYHPEIFFIILDHTITQNSELEKQE